MGLFSGDFIFVGDIGRPDLLEKAVKVEGSSEIGAKQMFKSIESIKDLPTTFKFGLAMELVVLVVNL